MCPSGPRNDPSYCWLLVFSDLLADNTARAIVNWSAAFGISKGFTSDSSTYLKDKTPRLVSRGIKVLHLFTRPYASWSSSAVEHVCEEVLFVFCLLDSEFQMRPSERLNLLSLVQSVISNSPSHQWGDICPVTAITGLSLTPPISTFTACILWSPLQSQTFSASAFYTLKIFLFGSSYGTDWNRSLFHVTVVSCARQRKKACIFIFWKTIMPLWFARTLLLVITISLLAQTLMYCQGSQRRYLFSSGPS